MKLLITILICVGAFSSFAAQTVSGFLRIPTGAASNGQNISTPAFFDSITTGDGNISWTTNSLTNCCFAVTESRTWPRAITVNGTLNYPDRTDNLAINIGLSNGLSSMIGDFTTQPTQVFCTMLIQFGAYHGGANVYDIMGINYGSYALIPQYWENRDGLRALFAHNANTPGLGLGIFSFPLNTWFVLTMYLDAAHNIGTITLYNADTGAFYASDSIFEPSGKQSAYLFIGTGSDHGTVTNPSDPIEIKDFTWATGALADTEAATFSVFEPMIWNIGTASVTTITNH